METLAMETLALTLIGVIITALTLFIWMQDRIERMWATNEDLKNHIAFLNSYVRILEGLPSQGPQGIEGLQRTQGSQGPEGFNSFYVLQRKDYGCHEDRRGERRGTCLSQQG